MFNTIKSRIGRTMVGAILPLGVTLGLTSNGLAQMSWNPRPAANQNQSPRQYSATMNGATITVRIDQMSSSMANGVIIIGTSECPFDARLDGQTLSGQIDYGNNQVSFTATIQGTVMYLDVAGTRLVLQQVA